MSVRGLALALGFLWGLFVLLSAVGHLLWGYGDAFLAVLDSLYPGYTRGAGWGSVLVATLYALLDGALAGAVLAWLYNRLSRQA